MTVKQFKIWLVTNGYTQKSLADKLKITDRTVSNYVSVGRFPYIFVLALVAVERGLNVNDLGVKQFEENL